MYVYLIIFNYNNLGCGDRMIHFSSFLNTLYYINIIIIRFIKHGFNFRNDINI